MKIGKTKPTIESSTETVLEHTVLVAESVSMQLPEALRKDYEIVGTWPNHFEYTGLEVSSIKWSEMTVPFMEHLIKVGFKGVRRRN